MASDGRCYLIAIDKLPSGRGLGEPLSLLVELGNGVELTALLVHRPDGRIVLASRERAGLHRQGERDRGTDPGRHAR